MDQLFEQARRQWLRGVTAFCAGSLLSPWPTLAAGTPTDLGKYGPLGTADEHGVRLPAGFQARLLASSGQRVAASDYVWHAAPDGGATFATPERGWVYVSNSEVSDQQGGVSALRFDLRGKLVASYAILQGTTSNCAGGPTPWGTWLSCEEVTGGLVYECDPLHPSQGLPCPLLGAFWHEAAAVDPTTGFVYLTEDDQAGRLYRFRPQTYGKLAAGVLEAALVGADHLVRWVRVPPDAPYRGADSTPFARAEGAWHARGVIYFTTTADHRVWAYSLADSRLAVIYDALAIGPGAILRDPDNLTVHAATGTLFVAEDADDLQLVMLTPTNDGWGAAPFVQFEGHNDSEVTGPAFSPDGTRLYLSSQRGRDGEHGMTFEIRGPFGGASRA